MTETTPLIPNSSQTRYRACSSNPSKPPQRRSFQGGPRIFDTSGVLRIPKLVSQAPTVASSVKAN